MYQSKEITKKVYNNIISQCNEIELNKIALNYKNGHYIYDSKNSQPPKRHVLILKFTDKLDLRRGKNRIAISNLSIYYTWKNIKSSYNNNKFKISALTRNDKFELPDGSYSVSDIQDCCEYILKKHGEDIDNPSVKKYVNKI